MKISIVVFIFLITCAFTCDDDDSSGQFLNEGTYTGEFFRSNLYADVVASSVTLTLKDGRFEGSSSMARYPAICKGTYAIDGDKITFNDECIWTADFDWTFILSGEYRLSKDKSVIEMKRAYDAQFTDVYRFQIPGTND